MLAARSTAPRKAPTAQKPSRRVAPRQAAPRQAASGKASSGKPAARRLSARDELIERLLAFRPELLARALKLAGDVDTAEDLVQDTVLRALRFENHFQRGTNLRGWANQILFSIFITRCRRAKHERRARALLTTAPLSWQLPSVRLQTVSLSPPVARALDSLPAPFRAAIVLVDLEEMAYKDAALLLGAPVGTVMSRLHRARALLAEQLCERSPELRPERLAA